MKFIKKVIAIGMVALMMTSCATVFGGKVSVYQRTKPSEGEPQRKIRVVALMADALIFWPSAVADFATGAIYKPEKKDKKKK